MAKMPVVIRRSAGGVVFVGDDVVLTSRRSFKGALQCGLPKGTVEQGETPQEAALRETLEETGLHAKICDELPTIDYWYVQPAGDDPAMRIHKYVHYFLMEATGGNIEDHDYETEQVLVLPVAQALRECSFASEKTLIEQAAKMRLG